MARLRETFESEIRPALMDRLKYRNPMQVPKLEKIVINMGVGEASQDRKKIDSAVEEMTLIAGQRSRMDVWSGNSLRSGKMQWLVPVALLVGVPISVPASDSVIM